MELLEANSLVAYDLPYRQLGDTVCLYRNTDPAWATTKSWDGNAWISVDRVIPGNLLVKGTVTGDKLAARLSTANMFFTANCWPHPEGQPGLASGSGTLGLTFGALIDGSNGAYVAARFAPSGIMIGRKRVSESWLNSGSFVAAKIWHLAGNGMFVTYSGQVGPLTVSSIGAEYIIFSTGAPDGVKAIAHGTGRHQYGWPIVLDPTNDATTYGGGMLAVFFSAYNGSPLTAGDTGLYDRTWTLSVQIMIGTTSF
jgi:hypothetical protein